MKTIAKEYFFNRFKEPVLSIKADGGEGVWKFFKVIGPKTKATKGVNEGVNEGVKKSPFFLLLFCVGYCTYQKEFYICITATEQQQKQNRK